HRDLYTDELGIQNLYLGSYTRIGSGGTVSGPGVYDVLKNVDAALAERLKTEIAASLSALGAIQPPFDQAISNGNPTGRATVQAAIDLLLTQTGTIGDAADALGVTININ
ncbi:MAG: imelysin family protein, partial [Gemmatimonadales bacterium]